VWDKGGFRLQLGDLTSASSGLTTTRKRTYPALTSTQESVCRRPPPPPPPRYTKPYGTFRAMHTTISNVFSLPPYIGAGVGPERVLHRRQRSRPRPGALPGGPPPFGVIHIK
jgi:hypothetical protein